MRARGFVHVYQAERSLFTNSSSSMEGHINKVIFSTCTLICSEWQLQLMKLRCSFKIVQDMESVVPMQSGLTMNNNDHETVMTVRDVWWCRIFKV